MNVVYKKETEATVGSFILNDKFQFLTIKGSQGSGKTTMARNISDFVLELKGGNVVNLRGPELSSKFSLWDHNTTIVVVEMEGFRETAQAFDNLRQLVEDDFLIIRKPNQNDQRIENKIKLIVVGECRLSGKTIDLDDA